jgi:NADPH:quinone reductase-like Zn-dependent oxidoreductase
MGQPRPASGVSPLSRAGKVTPVIDRIYPLDDAPEAIRYLETRHAQTKIVTTVSGTSHMTPDSDPVR